jgi:hypothetical protein
MRSAMLFVGGGANGTNGTGNGTGNGSNPDAFPSTDIDLFQLGLWTFVLLFFSFASAICIICSIDNTDPLLNPPKSKQD